MNIDLQKLSDQELIQLNREIFGIMQTRRQLRTMREMSKFHIGERVEFKDQLGRVVRGVVVRINQKTVSVETHQPCSQWRVSPQTLSKVADQPHLGISNQQGSVVELFRT